ncbi:nucleotidyl transferase AbiEii/AbiGii toxin family protein [Candidatus Daviesbacteria bacterium]|nr:nucleotidyl transferase AbiEii/AbiGii toxin family protein [Candidatus Daviesbacteria bacterium]
MKLTTGQKIALDLIAKSPITNKFYWTGGTLLAYYYFQHRKSEDLDFFTKEEFSFDEVNQFVQNLKGKAGFKSVEYQKIFDRHKFLLKNKEILKVEFVYYNHHRNTLGRRKKVLGVWADSLKDIAANKTLAYFDRNEPKDLFDIYFLLTKGRFTSKQLLGLVFKKFGVKLPESLFWSESFKNIKLLFTIKPLLLEKNNKEQMRLLNTIDNYFKDQSAQFLRDTLS